MRRAICAALLAVTAVVGVVLPAGADDTTTKPALSFDYSDNGNPPSASNGSFNIIVDVLSSHSGQVRIVADAPDGSGDANLVCAYQAVVEGQVECAFNFTSPGVWAIHAELAQDAHMDVVAKAVTDLLVGN